MITILSSASARPNFVKLAAVHHALTSREGVKHDIVHTGQHYDPLLSDIFFRQLQIPEPDENLGIKGGANREETIQMTADAMRPVLKLVHPDIVLVYGDVNGAVGAARAAADLGIKIGHIEAGLRSFDTDMPEELNRIEIDQLADELFITETSAEENIRRENLKGRVHFVGNTMIDTLLRMRPMIELATPPIALPPSFCVATLHRPSNVDDPETLASVMTFLAAVSETLPIIIPAHPRLQALLQKSGNLEHGGKITFIPPLGYLEFVSLLQKAGCILTDSGGVQEEATFLKKRCFTLRRNTERPATVTSGSNILIDPASEADRKKVLDAVRNSQPISVTIPEKWDGKAGERIADILIHHSSRVGV